MIIEANEQRCRWRALDALRQAKAEKRGAFRRRILLEAVTPPEG